jgi:hypothetical protein
MENVFDALCSALGEPEIKKLFLDSEGVDLMVLMMRWALPLFLSLPIAHPCVLYLVRSCNLGLVQLKCSIMPWRAHPEPLAARCLWRHRV